MRATSWPVRGAPTDPGFNLPKPLTASVCGVVMLPDEGALSTVRLKTLKNSARTWKLRRSLYLKVFARLASSSCRRRQR